MKKIFFSHSMNDYEAIETINILKNKFEKFGITSFSPMTDINIGSNFNNLIMESINSSNIVISFYNKESPSTLFELGYALGRNKKVVIVANHEELPLEIQHLSFINKDYPIYEIVNNIIYNIENMYLEKENYLEFKESSNIDYKIKCLSEDQNLLDSINGKEFEEMIISWFHQNGYRVETPKMQYDAGYDFKVFTKNGEEIIVEVKKYSSNSRVSVGIINQLLGIMSINKANKGMVICSSNFTKSAKEYTSVIEKEIRLITLDNLISQGFTI